MLAAFSNSFMFDILLVAMQEYPLEILIVVMITEVFCLNILYH